MPYLAFHTTLLTEADLPDGRPLIRHVDLRGETRAVLCGGFVRCDSDANAQNAVARYVAGIGGAVEDWEIMELTFVEYDAIELAVFQSIRDAVAASRAARLADLRDLLIAQTVPTSSLVGTDRVWKVPATVAEAKEFFKAMCLALDEVRDTLFEDES